MDIIVTRKSELKLFFLYKNSFSTQKQLENTIGTLINSSKAKKKKGLKTQNQSETKNLLELIFIF